MAGIGNSGNPGNDSMEVQILPDGTFRVTTDPISGANHLNAEQLLQFMEKQLGTKTEITSRKKMAHTHVQQHQHTGSGNTDK
jgi:hypothetical protein